jgi:integrase
MFGICLEIMKLLDQLRVVAQRRRLSPKTIGVYSQWVRQFLTFSAAASGHWKDPTVLGTAEVEAFLNDLVCRRRLSASAQNQALCALVFLYGKVLEDVIPQDHLGKFLLQRSRRPARVPTVLSADEVARLIAVVPSEHICRLPLELMYGTGMRVGEVCTLRVRDIDLGRAQVIVRAGKGDRDRIVMLPASLHDRLADQVATIEWRWRDDLARGGGYAPVPDALLHKRPPRAARAAVAVPVSIRHPSARRRGSRHALAPASGVAGPGDRSGREPRRHRQAGHLPHVPSFVRHAPP